MDGLQLLMIVKECDDISLRTGTSVSQKESSAKLS